ncbi:MAG: LysR family transcriptional regulator [Bdellovibrionota bacterium]
MKEAKRLSGNQINWNQVYYFSEVAASSSLKDAAKKLGVSPSTLSEHIAQLERDLEVQLFFRQHRKLSLTPEGNRLFLRAKEMFEAGQRLIDVVSPVPLGCYPISIGLVPCPSLQIAYSVITDYSKRYGPLSMKLFHSKHQGLEASLAKAEFDFGFSDRKPERKDLVYHCISVSDIRFYVSCSHEGTSLTDLLGSMPLLICNPEPNSRTFSEQALIDADLAPNSVITSDYPSSLTELCERGLGIGVFSEEVFSRSESKRLKALDTPRGAPKLQDHLYVLWSKEAENTEAVRHLRELVLTESA